MANLCDTELFKRLQQYRVDFAYSSKVSFNAADRLIREEQNKKTLKKCLEIISLFISIITFSSLASLYVDVFKDTAVIIMGILSLISIMISICLISVIDSSDSISFKSQANQYMILVKEIKNLEASIRDGLISIKELEKKVAYFHTAQIQIIDNKLLPKEIDYLKAKKAIETGQLEHTSEDIKNT